MSLQVESRQERLASALEQLFPASNAAYYEVARNLDRGHSIAHVIDELEGNDGDPLKDKDQLAKIVRSLERVARQISSLKYYGARALQVSSDQSPTSFSADSAIGFRSAIVDHVQELATWAKTAETITPTEAESTAKIFGETSSWGDGRPSARKTKAQLLAMACGEAYFEITGKRAVVSTDAMTNRAYGPFLEMVEVVFEFFDIEASAETWARRASESLR